MSESRGPILAENLSTVVAVAAVVAILSLAYGVYLHRELSEVAVGAAALDVRAAKRDQDFEKEIKALTDRVSALEAKAAAMPAADAAAPAVPAEAAPAEAAK